MFVTVTICNGEHTATTNIEATVEDCESAVNCAYWSLRSALCWDRWKSSAIDVTVICGDKTLEQTVNHMHDVDYTRWTRWDNG